MVFGMIDTLCGICDRLLKIVTAQQSELKNLGCNGEALRAWDREIEHLREMLRRIRD